ncbi:MAG: T9SS type A sorting domain-containing protein, partial [Bacteroidota bacterium]
AFHDLRMYAEITVNPDPMVQYQSVSGTVRVANYSPSLDWQGTIYVDLYNANDQFLGTVDQLDNYTLSSYHAVTWNFSKPSIQSSPGNYKLYVRVKRTGEDDINILPEGNYENGRDIQIIQNTSGQPDLTVSAINASPSPVNANNMISVQFTESNIGTVPAGPHRLYIGIYKNADQYDYYGYVNMDALASNESVTKTYTLPILPGYLGQVAIFTYTDGNGQISESDEGNNVKADAIMVIASSFASNPDPSNLPQVDLALRDVPVFSDAPIGDQSDVELHSSPATSTVNYGDSQIQLMAFPNPTSDNLTLQYELVSTTPVRIDLLDNQGRTVLEIMKTTTQSPGAKSINVDLSQLPAGIYNCMINTSNGKTTVPIVLTH